MVFAWAVFAYSAYYNKVKRQCFGFLDCPGQPSLAECLCPLPGLLFVRLSHLPFPFSAFGRPAAPAFCRRAAPHRRLTPSERKPYRRRVPPVRRRPGTGRRGNPRPEAAAYLHGCAARQRASRCAECAPAPPCGQACLPVSVWVLPYHQSPPSQIGDKLFEVSSNRLQMVVKIILYLIVIDKTVPKSRYRSHRLRPCQGNRPADRGQKTRLRAIIYRCKTPRGRFLNHPIHTCARGICFAYSYSWY